MHDSIYAITEEERAQIIGDILLFLERNAEIQKRHEATDVELSATVYLEKSERFLLLTKNEMEQLSRCGNISIRLDILCLSKKEFIDIQTDMIKERNLINERL